MNIRRIFEVLFLAMTLTFFNVSTALAAGPINVTASSVDGYYNAGKSISIQVVFDQSVIVDTTGGIPSLALNSGGTAIYSSGSGSETLTFIYLIGSSHNSSDLDYIAPDALTLNGGTINDGEGNGASLSLPPPGAAGSLAANKNIVVDTLPPTISIGASSVPVSKSGPVQYTITYADTNFSGSNLTYANVTLIKTGNADGLVSVTGSALTYTVTINTITGNGSLGIYIAAGTAWDLAGNYAPASSPSATFLVDNILPSFDWAAPVDTGGTYYVANEQLALAVDAVDNIAISKIVFKRYDYIAHVWVDIGTVTTPTSPPDRYTYIFNTSALLVTNNQINAEVFDTAGNSLIKYIWLYHYPTLTVTKAGTGLGTVTSSPTGINCGTICSYGFPYYPPPNSTVVTLTSVPTAPYAFTGWSGSGCTGVGTCTIAMDESKSVTATFLLAHKLSVSKSGSGIGTISSNPAGIDCGSTCDYNFAENSEVILTATPTTFSTFGGWSGAGCSGVGTCTVTMDAAKSVEASFTFNSYELSVSKSGSGDGTITSDPAGINCGSSCSYVYVYNTVVTLTATPAAAYDFGGWSGAGCSNTGTCTVTMNAGKSVTANFIPKTYHIYLPSILNRWPPIPAIPSLNPVVNTDQNNLYPITWSSAALANTYILEEATDPSFSNATVVYQGSALSWTTPQGKTPATYYYRLKARNSWGDSSWSNIQSVTIYPLFVGLQLKWDAMRYIRGSEYYDIGWHTTINLDLLTEPDTIRANYYSWYDPNPLGWTPDTGYIYYSVSTGNWLSSSFPDNPSWNWGFPWKLGYTSQFNNDQIVTIDGQSFTVTGPHAGYTAFGKFVQYWQFINNNKFLYWDGGDWKLYCNAGDVILRYDAGNSRLLLYDNVMSRYYYQGNLTSDTDQIIENLTSANFFQSGSTSDMENQPSFEIGTQTYNLFGLDFRDHPRGIH